MRCVGIDLGTTNTVAAVDGVPITFHRDSDGERYLPSVIAFPPNGTRLFGVPARRRRRIDPANTIYSSKRLIGRRSDFPEIEDIRKRFSFNLVELPDGTVAYRTRAGTFSPVDAAAMLLKRVLTEIDSDGSDVRAVIAVPAAFNQAQRTATLAAAREAGLKIVQLVDEPSATATAYSERASAGTIAVYDLGGGTFDFAVLDCKQRPYRIIGNEGDQFLGGDDIDQALGDWAADMSLKLFNWDLRSSPEVFDRLVNECEQAKIRLSTAAMTSIDLSQVDPNAAHFGIALPQHRGLPIDRETLNKCSGDFVRRTFSLCEHVLYTYGLRPRDLNAVVLAGGGTRLPLVRTGLERVFGTAPREDLSPMEVVSIGASMLAAT